MSEEQYDVGESEILRVLAGSGIHGIAIEGTDDRDELGIFIEPPEHVIGSRRDLSTVTFRTQPEGVRSGPGDLDLVRHGLRKYLGLAMKGNPNMLIPLFAEADSVLISTEEGRRLRAIRHRIVSQSAIRQHLGYLRSQVERMLAKRKLPNRPELIEKYGYDVKYASHAVRLAIQAYELASTGRISLPMEEKFRLHVLRVKTGAFTQAEVVEEIEQWERMIEKAMDRTRLRPEPDRESLDQWSVNIHLSYWRSRGWIR